MNIDHLIYPTKQPKQSFYSNRPLQHPHIPSTYNKQLLSLSNFFFRNNWRKNQIKHTQKRILKKKKIKNKTKMNYECYKFLDLLTVLSLSLSRFYIYTPSSKPLNHHCTRSHHMSSSTNNLKSLSDRHISSNNMPSRWYTVLALPFPDQKLGRRDINTFGRGVYTSRAGFFSNPLWVEANPINTCHFYNASLPM